MLLVFSLSSGDHLRPQIRFLPQGIGGTESN
jgi:hypothetical protein